MLLYRVDLLSYISSASLHQNLSLTPHLYSSQASAHTSNSPVRTLTILHGSYLKIIAFSSLSNGLKSNFVKLLWIVVPT